MSAERADKKNGNGPALEAILETARTLIADVGIDGLNMRDLAAATGSSLRTLYGHFGSKDQLLAIVISDTFVGLIDPFHESHLVNRSPVANLVQLAHSLQKIAIDRLDYVKVFMGLYHKHDADPRIPRMLFDMTYERVSASVNFLLGKRQFAEREIELLKEEITDRIIALMTKCAQRKIPDQQLGYRIVYSTLTTILPYASPAQAKEIRQELRLALEKLS